MDPVTSKIGTVINDPASNSAVDQAPKSGASSFDKIRAQLQQTADSLGIPLDPDITPPPAAAPAQKASATNRVDATAQARTKVEQNLSVSRHYIDRIHDQIKTDPSMSSLQKISGKLTSIENQYNQLDNTMRGMPQDATPTQWLRLQQMANSMNENINVLSKLVDSAASGVKTILQTQI
jgi:hypothetical protein